MRDDKERLQDILEAIAQIEALYVPKSYGTNSRIKNKPESRQYLLILLIIRELGAKQH